MLFDGHRANSVVHPLSLSGADLREPVREGLGENDLVWFPRWQRCQAVRSLKSYRGLILKRSELGFSTMIAKLAQGVSSAADQGRLV